MLKDRKELLKKISDEIDQEDKIKIKSLIEKIKKTTTTGQRKKLKEVIEKDELDLYLNEIDDNLFSDVEAIKIKVANGGYIDWDD